MKRLDFDESTKAFVQTCRAKVREHEVAVSAINDMMNSHLGEIAKKGGLVGNLRVSDDGTFLELPDPPTPSTK